MSQISESVSSAIRTAKSKGHPALVAYITAGFPRLDGFRQLLSAVADVADVVEVGVPFTDPMADGTTIQRSSRVALEQGVTLPWILEEITAAKPRSPVLLMSYLNPLLAYGIERLPQAIISAGVAGLIVPDLPYEECEEMRSALESAGCALVQFVTPVTPPERVQMLCDGSRGFIYAVTMTGTTGKNVAVPQEVLEYFARVRKVAKLPVCAGFGIRGADQVQRMAPYVDGVIVGSALIEVIERGEDPAAFLRALRS
jgi:tryptophan synthase alpha chain